jgi:hypothetical protein
MQDQNASSTSSSKDGKSRSAPRTSSVTRSRGAAGAPGDAAFAPGWTRATPAWTARTSARKVVASATPSDSSRCTSRRATSSANCWAIARTVGSSSALISSTTSRTRSARSSALAEVNRSSRQASTRCSSNPREAWITARTASGPRSRLSSSGSTPSGSVAAFVTSPAFRHGSRAAFTALRPAASPSKSNTSSGANRLIAVACSGVNAVPRGATTLLTPLAWSDTTSKFPSTSTACSACRIACLAWNNPNTSSPFR